MNERMPPEGAPPEEPTSGESLPPDTGPAGPPPSGGPIGWPEHEASAAAPVPPEPAAPATPPATPPGLPPGPAVQWQAPPASAAAPGARPPRTTLSAVAGAVLLALGVVGLLFGFLFLAFASVVADLASDFVDQMPGVPGGLTPEQLVGGTIGFLGMIVIAYSVVYLLGGIGVLRSAEWGRVTGIVVAIISGLIWGSGLSSTAGGGSAFTVVMFLIHVYVFFVLAFRWREPAVPASA